MKKVIFLMLTAVLLPAAAMAQDNIHKAFKAMESDGSQTVKVSKYIDRDPATDSLISSVEVYTFTTEDWHDSFKQVQKAFDEAEPNAYSVYQNTEGGNGQNYSVSAGSTKIIYGNKDNLINMCFADKEHPGYRYVYAMEWSGDKKITGRLIYAYGVKPKQRNKNASTMWNITVNGNNLGDMMQRFFDIQQDAVNSSDNPEEANRYWFQKFLSYCRMLEDNVNRKTTADMLVNRIYQLCKNSQGAQLNDSEVKVVGNRLKELQALVKDSTERDLLQAAAEYLKK